MLMKKEEKKKGVSSKTLDYNEVKPRKVLRKGERKQHIPR